MTWDGWLANAVAFASLTVALAVALGARVKIRALRRRVEQLAAGTAGPGSAGPGPAAPAAPAGPRAVAVVYNPVHVGALDDIQAVVEQAAIDAGYAPPVWLPTAKDDPGVGQTRAALALDPAVVVAVGGDGTIRHVAGELAGSGVPLGILPTGTGNLLARNLGLPIGSGVRDLASIAITGRSRRIDVGWVEADGPSLEQTAAIARIAPDSQAFAGSTPFLVIAGMGFDAAVMHSAGRGLKRTMGWGAYVVSGLRYLRRRRVKAHIVAGEGHNEFDLEARAILFANCGRLPGGFVLAPDARIDDGWLDLVVVDTKIGLLGWGDLVRRVGLQSLGLRRRPQMLPEVGSIELRRMRSVHVQAGDPELVEADGDALGYAWNVRARIERGTLLVHVL